MSKNSAKTSNASKTIIWILLALLVVSIIVGVFQTIRLNDSKASQVANGGIYDGDVVWLSEVDEQLPVIEKSNAPETVVVPMLTSELIALNEPQPLDLVPASTQGIDISPMAGTLTFSPTTSPSSLTISETISFWINTNQTKNLTDSGIIFVEQSEGFVVRIAEPDVWGDNGEVFSEEWYLYYTKDGSSWYRAKSSIGNNEYNFASMGRGTYQFCAYKEHSADYNDGSGAIVTKARSLIYTVAYDIPEEQIVEIPDAPAKEGYTFVGWFTDSQLTQKFKGPLILEENITLYAKYVINRYTVTFEVNGGSVVNSLTVDWNTTVNFGTQVTTRFGHDFLGWFSDQACTNEVTSLAVKSDMTVYAGWEIKIVYVTLIVDGVEINRIPYDFGTIVSSIISDVETVTHAVSAFSTGGIIYNEASSVAQISSDMNMYLEAKSFDDQVKSVDWLLVGIVAGSIVVIGTIILFIIYVINKKKNRVEVIPVVVKKPSAKKPASKSKK